MEPLVASTVSDPCFGRGWRTRNSILAILLAGRSTLGLMVSGHPVLVAWRRKRKP